MLKKNPKIVILDGIGVNPGDLSWNNLKALGDVEIYENTEYDQIIERSKDAEIIVVNKCRFDEYIFNNLPKLKFLCESATGYDNIDIDSANKHNIFVSNVRNYSTESVVQHVFALILALVNKTEYYSKEVSSGRWTDIGYFTFWDSAMFELTGKTIGIYGFGKIGSRVAQVAQAFGMKVIANRKNPEKGYSTGIHHAEIEELLSQSDILSLHAPLAPENENFINIDSLKKMKSSAILINTSRGKVINENDLAKSLNDEMIAGAGLDVLRNEPPRLESPLLHSKNCIITPHQAWTSIEARQKLMNGIIENIEGYLKGNPVNVVN